MGGTCSSSAHTAVAIQSNSGEEGSSPVTTAGATTTTTATTRTTTTRTTTTTSTTRQTETPTSTNREGEDSGRPRLRIRNPTRTTETASSSSNNNSSNNNNNNNNSNATPRTLGRRFRRSLSASNDSNNNNNNNNTATNNNNSTASNNDNTSDPDTDGLSGDLHMMQLLFQAMVARAILDNLSGQTSTTNNNNNNTTTTPSLTPAALAALASASENAQGLDGLETLLPFFAAAMNSANGGIGGGGGISESSAPPPASRRVLERLPKASVTERDLAVAGELNRECCICLVEHDASAQEEVTRLPCGHLFHKACAVEWLSKSCTCPVCRYELATDDASYEPGRLERMAHRRVRLRLSELEGMSPRELKHLAFDILRLSFSSAPPLEKTELVRRIVDCARVDIIDAHGQAMLKEDVVLKTTTTTTTALREETGTAKGGLKQE